LNAMVTTTLPPRSLAAGQRIQRQDDSGSREAAPRMAHATPAEESEHEQR
jgi:hypothetical protein